MTAYVSVEFTPLDQESLKAYSAKAAVTIAKYEGEFIVKSPIQTLNGLANHKYQAIIAFPSKIKAEDWYHSSEYQALLNIRNKGMDAKFQLLG